LNEPTTLVEFFFINHGWMEALRPQYTALKLFLKLFFALIKPDLIYLQNDDQRFTTMIQLFSNKQL